VKSYVTYVMALYEGIREDTIAWWPDTRSSMDMDLSYLRRAFEQRGLGFFTLTLPDYGHWITRSLDHGSFIDYSEIPRGIPLYRKRPRLFWGVLKKVFDTSGVLKSDADPRAVLTLRTLTESWKKLETPVSPHYLKKTIKEFFDVEQHLPHSRQDTWDSDIPSWQPLKGHPLWGDPAEGYAEQPDLFGSSSSLGHRIPWDTLGKLCRRAISEIGVPDWWSIRPKHGPGVVSERDVENKYEFPTWPRKLDLWFPFEWFGSGDLSSELRPPDDEPPSRLIAVPKSQKGPRLICAEPTAHQWMQQGIWRWLEGRIGETLLGRSISFKDQRESQLLALSASHSRSHATLDLSAASDRLSTRLVEYVFQGSDILNGFHACRTRMLKQSLSSEFPKLTKLRKFATMGSALTFPVQSIVFTILSVWALRLYEGNENNFETGQIESDFDRVRVFGDDIIVPNDAYGLTKFVLHECGLLVNHRKSFSGHSFRESCGMDAFKGVDVTPPRIHKDPLSASASSTAALIEYTNNLYKKGFWHASTRVLDLLPGSTRRRLLVSGPDEGGLGLYSFGRSNLGTFKRFWDTDLQRNYCLRLAFTTRVKRHKGRGEASMAQFFFEDPVRSSYLRPIESDRLRVDLQGTRLRQDNRLEVSTIYRQDRDWQQPLIEPVDWSSGSASVTRLRAQLVRTYL
jgi:hypothetical protein